MSSPADAPPVAVVSPSEMPAADPRSVVKTESCDGVLGKQLCIEGSRARSAANLNGKTQQQEGSPASSPRRISTVTSPLLCDSSNHGDEAHRRRGLDGCEDGEHRDAGTSKKAKFGSKDQDDSDSDGGSSDEDGGTKLKHSMASRREKNRLAARKCRAKKMQFMLDMENKVRDLMRKNEEMKVQMMTMQKMFSREVKLREAMKVILQARWNSANPFPGYTANDIIIGLESGTLDVNTILNTTISSSKPTILSSSLISADLSYDPLLTALGSDDHSAAVMSVLPDRESIGYSGTFAQFGGGFEPTGFSDTPFQPARLGQCITTGVPYVKNDASRAPGSSPPLSGIPRISSQPVGMKGCGSNATSGSSCVHYMQ